MVKCFQELESGWGQLEIVTCSSKDKRLTLVRSRGSVRIGRKSVDFPELVETSGKHSANPENYFWYCLDWLS